MINQSAHIFFTAIVIKKHALTYDSLSMLLFPMVKKAQKTIFIWSATSRVFTIIHFAHMRVAIALELGGKRFLFNRYKS